MLKLNNFVVAFLLLILSVVTYSNSLHNDFMMDDQRLILQDNKIHNINFLYYQFIPDKTKALNLENKSSDSYYRPMAQILPMLSYLAFKDNVLGYHFVNLFLFFLVCFFIYILIKTLTKNRGLAFLSSALFCVHPINGLFVNYITANVFALQMIAMIGSILIFLSIEKKGGKAARYFISLLLFLIALFCHETSMALPFYIFSVLFIFHKKDFKTSVIQCLPYFILLGVFMLFRMHYASLKVSIIDKIATYDMNLFEYIATFSKIIVWYLSKLIVPVDIVLIWAIHIVRQGVFLWVLAFILAVIYCAKMFLGKNRGTLNSLFVSWIFIGFLPVSFACMFQPASGFMIEPHWLFFSSIGFFIITANLLLKLYSSKRSFLALVLIIVLLVSYIITSRHYNKIWGNQKEYCKIWIKNIPALKVAAFYLAETYAADKDYENAKYYYEKAIENRFSDWQIYTNLGLISENQGNLEDAMQYFNTALSIFPESAIINNNIANLYLQENDLDSAEEYFNAAVKLNRFLLKPRFALAEIYRQKDMPDEELAQYKENLNIDPKDEKTLLQLIQFKLRNGKNSEARELAGKMFNISNDPEMLTSVGSLMAQYAMADMALTLFKKSLKINKSYSETYLELGKMYGNYEEFDKAINIWLMGLSRNPDDSRFLPLIDKAKELRESAVTNSQ